MRYVGLARLGKRRRNTDGNRIEGANNVVIGRGAQFPAVYDLCQPLALNVTDVILTGVNLVNLLPTHIHAYYIKASVSELNG